MQALSTTDALRLWETGAALCPAERVQALLAAVHPDAEPSVLASLTIGHRNARLLQARAATLGRVLACEATCPACGERLEFGLDIDVLLSVGEARETIEVEHEGRSYSFRLPTDADLMAVRAQRGDAHALLDRCLAERDGGRLPDAVAREAEKKMAEADPLALIRLDLVCPACSNAWEAPLDVAGFFFAELAEQARHALVDVHQLARAYGWREADVLALSPWRRQQYLALLDG